MPSWSWLATLLGIYAGAAFAVPTKADVSILEDWIYRWPADRMASDGVLDVLAISGPTSVFEALWGGAFTAVLGSGYGTLRVSTLILVGIGSVGLWWLLGSLGVETRLRALGTALYLFNPISFALSYTFMTDAHMTALMVLSTAFFVSGFIRDRELLLAGGSLLAGVGYLSRPQALIVVVAASILAVQRRRIGWITVIVAPAVVFVLTHLLWAGATESYSTTTQEFIGAALDEGFGDLIGASVAGFALVLLYVGFFAIPGALLKGWQGFRNPLTARTSRVSLAAVAAAVLFAMLSETLLPFGDWLSTEGLGPVEIGYHGMRSDVLSPRFAVALTLLSAMSLLWLGSCLPATRQDMHTQIRGFMLWTGGLYIATLAPAVWFFRGFLPDRYMLPVLPVVIVVSFAGMRNPKRLWLVGCFAVLFGLFSIAGVHDMLEREQQVWSLATEAVEGGIPLTAISASAAWDGSHFGPATSQAHEKLQARVRGAILDWAFVDAPVWWIAAFAPQIEPEYVIAVGPLPGAQQLAIRRFEVWTAGTASDVRLYRLPSSHDISDSVVGRPG